MTPSLVELMLRTLLHPSASPLRVTREMVVAYATLAAWSQHWPSRVTADVTDALTQYSWIRIAEPDRYIKQRRIAIARLANELQSNPT